MSKRPIKTKAEPETTGHQWDGIEEYNNPLPRWWLWTFYATIIWGIAYTIAYPAWPLVSSATQGFLNQNTRADVAAEIDRYEAANAPIEAKLEAADLTAIASDPELANYTNNAGGAVFRTWCAQCHGSGAAGAIGYPNLLDNDWLWGGTIEDIHTTILHGIRNTTDDDARYSEMPKFGADELLEPEQIDQVVQYVLQISGQEYDAALAAEGATVFADNCSSCHAEDGTGDRAQGAPDLTDAIWLYGGDQAALTETVNNARFGVMPAWAGRLSEADIRAVASWVHSQGGGE
ncbi:MAG: cytochrome-c oxidase, cbb3-type subunit III [Paracoccaceae bacterium]